ncbi:MAG TPA: 8-amino-7-oxononanoate synthase [Candidatus Competibacteraceae bacterium]|nr:8-amino-7-oxononanoate synthase [Candidatus Competibacteraceae bacterium]
MKNEAARVEDAQALSVMPSTLQQRLAQALAQLPAAGRRRLMPYEAVSAARVCQGGYWLLNFAGNDYLGLAGHPALAAAAARWAQDYGTGMGASRLLTGTLEACERLEARLAVLKGTEAALILPGGFQANATVLAALLAAAGATPLVYSDRLNHASMHFGLAAGGVRQIRFRHNDLDHLQDLLRRDAARPGARLIVSESVFSMDGDRADIAGLVALAERYGAFLYIDEAHATGVFGPGGAGLCHGYGRRIDLLMGTFGKALGGFGAFVACSRMVRDYLINRCAGLIYATALPPPVLGAIAAALDLLPELDEERRRLVAHGDRLRQRLQAAGYDTLASTTQIIPVVLGEEQAVLDAAARLREQGLLVAAIRPPTVARGSSRLRISLSAAHTAAEVDALADALVALAERP